MSETVYTGMPQEFRKGRDVTEDTLEVDTLKRK